MLFIFILSLALIFAVDSLDDESNVDGYDSVSSGTCAFPLRFEEYVGCVNGLVSVFFVLIGV